MLHPYLGMTRLYLSKLIELYRVVGDVFVVSVSSVHPWDALIMMKYVIGLTSHSSIRRPTVARTGHGFSNCPCMSSGIIFMIWKLKTDTTNITVPCTKA